MLTAGKATSGEDLHKAIAAKDLTTDDYTRLNGRVARILAKGNLTGLDELVALVRSHARRGKARAAMPKDGANAQAVDRG